MKNKPILYLPIGISGSGKSTYFKNNFLIDFPEVSKILDINELSLSDIIVCPDNIRLELFGDIDAGNKGDWWNSKKAWSVAYDRVEKLLKEYGVAILDAVNTNSSTRSGILKNYEYAKKTALVFRPDIESSNCRIRKQIENSEIRSDVPIEVLERQFTDFKKSVVNDLKYDGEWNNDVKNKIKNQLNKKFSTIKFIDNHEC
jgi:predicted kinase